MKLNTRSFGKNADSNDDLDQTFRVSFDYLLQIICIIGFLSHLLQNLETLLF
jgi:hypothetical protein